MMKKVTWEEFFHKHGEKGGKPYEFREHYHDNVIVTHPKFGRGFVSEVLSDSKVEITFKDSRRVLVHNRKDMPGLPLAAEGDGRPTTTKAAPPPVKAPPPAAAKAKAPAKEPPAPAKEPPPAKASAAKAATPPKANISPAAAAKNRKPVPQPPARPAKAAATPARTAKPARAVNDASAKRSTKVTPKSAAKKSKK